jgi:23S rRNA (adenine2503-C2)-methyltransferase
LVPTTKFPMTELRQGLIDALNSRRNVRLRTTMLEVALMEGINDTVECADALAEFCRPIVEQVAGCKLMVNLIPYNDTGGLYMTPSRDRVLAFQQRLWQRGVYTHVRTTRGDDESAACGQLATLKAKAKGRLQ